MIELSMKIICCCGASDSDPNFRAEISLNFENEM
jgi:hypothetical protein